MQSGEDSCCINTMQFECKNPNGQCNLQCSGIHACQGIDVKENKLSIGCQGKSSCQKLQAQCKIDQDCQLNCQGQDTCKEVKTNGIWNTDCQGNAVCGNIVLNEHVGTVACTGMNSCLNLKAKCSSGKSCSINCMGLNTCQGKSLQGNWQNTGFQLWNTPATSYGFNGVGQFGYMGYGR